MKMTGLFTRFLKRLREALAWQVFGVIGSVAWLLCLYVLLYFMLGEAFGLVALLNHGAFWLWLAAIGCAVTLLFAPARLRWVWLLPTLLPIVVGCVWFLPYFSPANVGRQPTAAPGLRVMTFNILGDTITPERVNIIRDVSPDIVGIQETRAIHSNFAPIWDAYPYRVLREDLPEMVTVAKLRVTLFSRHPIDQNESRYIGNTADRGRPAAIRTVVNVGGQRIAVYVAHFNKPHIVPQHLLYDAAEREAAVRLVVEAIQAEALPAILMCDCNLTDLTGAYAHLDSVLVDAWRQAGFGMGFTAPTRESGLFPIARVDYIWHTADLETLAVQVHPTGAGSDHHPLIADLGIVPQG